MAIRSQVMQHHPRASPSPSGRVLLAQGAQRPVLIPGAPCTAPNAQPVSSFARGEILFQDAKP